MRIWLLCCALIVASPLSAQTAVSLDLRGSGPAASGADITASQGFTLRRLGIWEQPPPPVTTVDALADTVSPRAMFGISVPSGAPGALSGNSCDLAPVPRHIPGLHRSVAERRLMWWHIVARTECRYGLPAGLLDAVILQESRYQPGAVSSKGAIGLAQLMPGTAGDLGVANAYDPLLNIDGGGRYLRDMLDRFNSIALGIAAYNAGPGAVRSSRGIPRNSETPDYVRKVFGYWSASPRQNPLVAIRQEAQLLGFAPIDK